MNDPIPHFTLATLAAVPPLHQSGATPAQVAAQVGLARNTVSAHLRTLERHGLVKRYANGAQRGDRWGRLPAGSRALGLDPRDPPQVPLDAPDPLEPEEVPAAGPSPEPQDVLDPDPGAQILAALGDPDRGHVLDRSQWAALPLETASQVQPPVGSVVEISDVRSPFRGAVGVVVSHGETWRGAPAVYLESPALPVDTDGRTPGRWFHALDVSPDLRTLAAVVERVRHDAAALSGATGRAAALEALGFDMRPGETGRRYAYQPAVRGQSVARLVVGDLVECLDVEAAIRGTLARFVAQWLAAHRAGAADPERALERALETAQDVKRAREAELADALASERPGWEARARVALFRLQSAQTMAARVQSNLDALKRHGTVLDATARRD